MPYTKTLEEGLNQVIQGDCLEVMAKLPDGSIDAIICDPPLDYQ